MSDFVPAAIRIPDITQIGKRKLQAQGDERLHWDDGLPLEQIHVEEIIKCSQDVIYFAENYVKIVNLDKGEHYIQLYDYQKEILKTLQYNTFSALNLSRQTGKSYLSGMFCVWDAIFHNDRAVQVGSYTGTAKSELFHRMIEIFRGLPHFIKPGITELNKSTIRLTNGSVMHCGVISKRFGRSFSINTMILDEVAFVDVKIWKEFYASFYPTISSARDLSNIRLIMISTPNGINHWYDLVTSTKRGKSEFKLLEYDWTCVPRTDEEKRKFKETTIKNIIANGGDGNQIWSQEYCLHFLSSSHGLFSATALSLIETKQPIKRLYNNKFKIFSEPKKDHSYLLIVDPSEGTGGDYLVVLVIDVSSKPFEQAAVYRDNNTQLGVVPSLIESISKYYDDALSLIEYNSTGLFICNKLWYDNEFENLFFDHEHQIPGLRTTKSSRKTGTTKLKEMVENGMFIINDEDTLREFSNFVSTSSGKFEGVGGNDDIVMTFVIFAYFTTIQYFDDNYNISWLSNYQNRQENKIKDEILDEDSESDLSDIESFKIYSNIDRETDDIGYF